MLKKRYSVKYDKQGQVLLFVVLALTVSTVVGVAVATRTLSTTKRVSSTDTYAKVFYSAEAGIERFADQTNAELLSISQGSGCGSTGATLADGVCSFNLGLTENIATETSVTVEQTPYNVGAGTAEEHLAITLDHGTFSGVNISNYNETRVRLCWNSGAATATGLYYVVYTSAGISGKAVIVPNTGVPFAVGTTVVADPTDYAGYSDCYVVTVPQNNATAFMQVTSLGGNSELGVFPNGSADLPNQGFLITSRATLNQTDTQVQVSKVLSVFKTRSFVPGFFNAAIYAVGDVYSN